MNVNLPIEFSARLREERKRLGMNQTEFAKATGIHLNSQSRYENGDRAPDMNYLAALSRLGVDISFLFTGERGRDLKLERDAGAHVVFVIEEFLGFAKGELGREFRGALQASYEAYARRHTHPDDEDRADDRLRDLLRKSPETLPSREELAELLWKLELALQQIQGATSQDAQAGILLQALRRQRSARTPLDRQAVEEIVRMWAY
ncbi:MAG: hypothetical protein C0607_03145 [Azoarcus sp.]|nr:MAG: hypothetical protein C0607_03145 [Azoarcus sp.]